MRRFPIKAIRNRMPSKVVVNFFYRARFLLVCVPSPRSRVWLQTSFLPTLSFPLDPSCILLFQLDSILAKVIPSSLYHFQSGINSQSKFQNSAVKLKLLETLSRRQFESCRKNTLRFQCNPYRWMKNTLSLQLEHLELVEWVLQLARMEFYQAELPHLHQRNPFIQL